MAKPTPKPGDFDIDKEIAQLTPEQAELFLRALELTMKKRRMMLFGYVSALVVILGGMIGALYVWAAYRHTFIAWVFLVPFACAGGLIILFGKLVKRIGKTASKTKASSASDRAPGSARPA